MPAPKRSSRSSEASQISEKRKAEDVSISLAEYYEREDAEAMSLNWTDLEQNFLEHSTAIRRDFATLMGGKCEGDALASIGESLLSHWVSMRRLNRLGQYRNRRRRDDVLKEMAVVEEKFLKLQNVNSEVEHLNREIDRCLEFRSADEEIDLIPIDQFYASAPPAVSNEEVTRNDAHQLRLARLNWEMTERTNLLGTLQEREGRRNVLNSDIATKELKLKSLKPKVQAVIEAAKPIQELMGLQVASAESQAREEAFSYLPKDLFVIALQTRAFADISSDGGVSVQCVGDVEAAIKYAENGGGSTEVDDDDEHDKTASDHEAEESGSRLRRRRSTVSEQIARRKESTLSTHPLQLVIDVTCEEGMTVSLAMCYVPELRCVGVKAKLSGSSFSFFGNILCDDTLLSELYPGDDGELCPDKIGQVKLDQLQLKVSEYESRLGRFYMFARKMAGTGEANTSGATLCDVVQSVVGELRSRVRSRCKLIQAFHSLTSLKLFDVMTPEVRERFPKKILSFLTEFRVATAEQFLAFPSLTSDYRRMIERERGSSADNGFYFSAVIERGPKAKLTAFIYLGVSYPQHSRALFVLLLNLNGNEYRSYEFPPLFEIEKELNTGSALCTEKELSDVAIELQIAYLVSSCDVLLEVESARSETDTFGKEHLYARLTRGRDRQLPLAYHRFTDSFTFPSL